MNSYQREIAYFLSFSYLTQRKFMKKIGLMFLFAITTSCNSSFEEDNAPTPFPDNLPVNLPDIPCQD